MGSTQGHRFKGVLWAITKGFFSVKFRIVDFLLSSQFPQGAIGGWDYAALCMVLTKSASKWNNFNIFYLRFFERL